MYLEHREEVHAVIYNDSFIISFMRNGGIDIIRPCSSISAGKTPTLIQSRPCRRRPVWSCLAGPVRRGRGRATWLPFWGTLSLWILIFKNRRGWISCWCSPLCRFSAVLASSDGWTARNWCCRCPRCPYPTAPGKFPRIWPRGPMLLLRFWLLD